MLAVRKCIPGLTSTSKTLNLFCSYFHSSQIMLKLRVFNAQQISVLTQKFLLRNDMYFKRKKESTPGKPLNSASGIFGSENPAIITRRMQRLNKIFMEKISETLLTLQHAEPLWKIGFEITQIKVQPKLANIHVYFYYSEDTDEDEFNNLLLNLSHQIRTELNGQHILGRIPPLLFIKDSVKFNSIEIEKRLKIADFGPDETAEDFLNNDSGDNLSESANSPDDKFGFPDDVIMIRQNVLGVNRGHIMKDVIKKCKESKGMHRLADGPSPTSGTSLQAEAVKQYSLNANANLRTLEIKKWASKFKKERKSRAKKDRLARDKDEEENLDSFLELEDDFDVDDDKFYEEHYDLDK